jgi:hypothetical protein
VGLRRKRLGRATDGMDWYYPDIGKGGVSIYHFVCPDYDQPEGSAVVRRHSSMR